MFATVSDWIIYVKNQNKLNTIELNVGCGSRLYADMCNIDFYPSTDEDTHRGDDIRPDVWCDIKNLSCEDSVIDVIYCSHVLEHFYPYEVEDILIEVKRVLKPGGIFVVEMPDFARVSLLSILWFLPEPRYPSHMKSSRGIFKSQFYGASWERNVKGYPYHKYLYTRGEFVNLLQSNGFKICLTTSSTLTHVPLRDMAVIASYKSITVENSKVIEKWLHKYTGNNLLFKRKALSFYRLLKRSIIQFQ